MGAPAIAPAIISAFFARHAAKVFCVLLFSLPLIFSQYLSRDLSSENRVMSKLPPLPATVEDVLAYPAALEPFINERFAMRAQLVKLNTQFRYRLFRAFPTPQVIEGRNGYNFFASHNPQSEPFSAIRLACGDSFVLFDYTLQQFNMFERHFRKRGFAPRILVVPSGPVIYHEHLPEWLAERCDLDELPILKMLASPKLTPAVRDIVYFPLKEIRKLDSTMPAMPQHFFHWSGGGPKVIAETIERHFWSRSPETASTLRLAYTDGPSDYYWLYPGIEVIRKIGRPDFAGSPITPCEGGHCFPELEGPMKKLADVARYRNSAPGLHHRMVIIGDSFAPNAAPWFARYYQEVVLVGTNFLTQLSFAERRQLADYLFRADSGDHVLYIYHDATVYSGRIMFDIQNLFPPSGRRISIP